MPPSIEKLALTYESELVHHLFLAHDATYTWGEEAVTQNMVTFVATLLETNLAYIHPTGVYCHYAGHNDEDQLTVLYQPTGEVIENLLFVTSKVHRRSEQLKYVREALNAAVKRGYSLQQRILGTESQTLQQVQKVAPSFEKTFIVDPRTRCNVLFVVLGQYTKSSNSYVPFLWIPVDKASTLAEAAMYSMPTSYRVAELDTCLHLLVDLITQMHFSAKFVRSKSLHHAVLTPAHAVVTQNYHVGLCTVNDTFIPTKVCDTRDTKKRAVQVNELKSRCNSDTNATTTIQSSNGLTYQVLSSVFVRLSSSRAMFMEELVIRFQYELSSLLQVPKNKNSDLYRKLFEIASSSPSADIEQQQQKQRETMALLYQLVRETDCTSRHWNQCHKDILGNPTLMFADTPQDKTRCITESHVLRYPAYGHNYFVRIPCFSRLKSCFTDIHVAADHGKLWIPPLDLVTGSNDVLASLVKQTVSKMLGDSDWRSTFFGGTMRKRPPYMWDKVQTRGLATRIIVEGNVNVITPRDVALTKQLK